MKLPEHLLFLRRKTLPSILSVEGAECGLACMAMVAKYHGHDIDLNGLRQRFPISMSGANLRSIMTLADQLGFSTRALRVELFALAKVRMPAIVHWDLDHFVVLKSMTNKTAVIHDPSRGRIEMGLDEISKHFTGIVLEISPSVDFKPVTAKVPLKLTGMWSKSYGLETGALFVLILSVALQLASFALPFQMQLVVDEAIGHNDLSLLTVIALGFGGLTIFQAVLAGLRDWTLQLFGNQMVFQMSGNLLRHLLKLPSSFFEKRHVGDILSRLGSTNAIQNALTQGIIGALIDGAMAIIAGTIMFVYSPMLAMVVMVSVLVILGLTFAYYPIMRSRTNEMINSSALVQSHMMESVRAATTIKLMGREAERESSWRNLYSHNFNASVSLGRFQISVGTMQSITLGLQSILVVYLGARAILLGDGFSVGMLMAFLSFRQTFTDRAQSLVAKAFEFRMLNLHLERLADIVMHPPESNASAPISFEVKGGLSLSDVAFRYGSSDPWIFQNLTLNIAPGDFVAIVGPSGAGKTTLLKLLLGLQLPSEGEVFLDGLPAKPELWRTWRSQIGLVAQDDRLLSGTLADNIAFFDPDMNMQAVQEAASAAQIHADIDRMPMKYLTLVGDMGSSLSGGQRQRILLARALYRQPKILILDEGTANLDSATEDAIAQLVTQLPITRIVVAHRPALVQHATTLLVVEGGRVHHRLTQPPANEDPSQINTPVVAE
jgi:ATP-binding cassette subfamily B protein RaxB